MVDRKSRRFLSRCTVIPVLLHPTAVLGLRGKPGWAGHGVLTPSQLYQDLAVEPGQAVVEHKVPCAAPSSRCHFTLWPQPRLLRAGWLGCGGRGGGSCGLLPAPERMKGAVESTFKRHPDTVRPRVWSWLFPLVAVCPWVSDFTSQSQFAHVGSGVTVLASAGLCGRQEALGYSLHSGKCSEMSGLVCRATRPEPLPGFERASCSVLFEFGDRSTRGVDRVAHP